MEENLDLRLKDFKAQAFDAFRIIEQKTAELRNLNQLILQTEQAILAEANKPKDTEEIK